MSRKGSHRALWAEAFRGRDFESRGFLVVPRVVQGELLETLRAEADRLLTGSAERGGVRNGLAKSAVLSDLAGSGVPLRMARSVLGSQATPTKLTIFDKTSDANWRVPWHQDLTITVAERCDHPGYGPWSVKDGLPHVQPPVHVLQQTVAVRLHLDDTPSANGALRVLPGTHLMGRLLDVRIQDLRSQIEAEVCSLPAGGAMLMSPLLLHSSCRAASPKRRRVLHFEYSAALLPEGLSWACWQWRRTPPGISSDG